MSTLTSEAKQLLSRTVRELRERLLLDLHAAGEGRYRLSLPPDKAKLPEELRMKRARLDAWLDERVRTANPKDKKATEAARARFLAEAQKEAAATFLNRLVLLRHLEALGLLKPAVLTGGWSSKGYQELREFAPGLCGDESEGYATLLQLAFDELALDLPGLFGDVGLTRLFPIPPATLREVVQRLEDPGLESAWTDDTTLGWVYQYWNDPEREALDKKLNEGGKVEPYEIASKSQMFTERYMVEWLLQNSLGLMWLCMCRKHGWTADAEQVLPALEVRRAEWRKRREAGEVALDALMPIEGELEERWKYFVSQPIPDDAVASAPESVKALKLLDPACGSGHFLVIAFDLLAALYREEACHRGVEIGDRETAESILENNLHGIDIDPRAVQIAAAAVMLKAKHLAPDARPRRVNLVAPVLRLGALEEDDPALVRLRDGLMAEAGIPEELTGKLVASLAGVDHLGSLLKVDAAIDEAIRVHEIKERVAAQGDLLRPLARAGTFRAGQRLDEIRATLQDCLEAFLARHTSEEDLGLRLDGEQLAAGVRFVRIAKEGTYDLVAGNPPYQGTSRLADAKYVAAMYPRGKADLFAAFIERALELVRPGGFSALVTMRSWMFLGQFAEMRKRLLHANDLRLIADLGTGAFSSRSMDDVISTVLAVVRGALPSGSESVAIQAAPLVDPRRDAGKPARRRAALVAAEGRNEFRATAFDVVAGEPIAYRWTSEFLTQYARAQKLGDVSPARKGLCTGADTRFTRRWWEVPASETLALRDGGARQHQRRWAASINGGEGLKWFEPFREVCPWHPGGLEFYAFTEKSRGIAIRNPSYYFEKGVAFSMVGSTCEARAHRFPSVFLDKGSSVFPGESRIPETLCLMNSAPSAFVLSSLNPTLSFQVGDVNRVPVLPIPDAAHVYGALERAFEDHERSREASPEFRRPGNSHWGSTQEWAQRAVDRAAGELLPSYSAEYELPTPPAIVSFFIGISLGRFGARGEGVLDEAPRTALPAGILYVSAASEQDSVAHPACAPLHAAWSEHGAAVGDGDDVRTWLRTGYFKHHKSVYESRPIYFPLSSAKKNFVAWVSIHRWTSNTLSTLLADHLVPERRRLEGEIDDLRKARANPEKSGKVAAERRFAEVQKLLEELTQFIDLVTQCAERGPPPTSPNETKREVDARYEMDLDDGVMVNSAALWPLLEPQWKDPKKWWKDLAEAKGRKDYDWAHLAKRYFPSRVEDKCKEDPSLAVAHGCFWSLFPAKAYAWELRLQDEIRPDFTIDEPGSDQARARFLKESAQEAAALRDKEADRRERKARKAGQDEGELALPLGEVDAEIETEPEIEEAE